MTTNRISWAVAFFVPTLAASAAIWTVDDDLIDYPDADFQSIADAVAIASSGDEIQVYPGTYDPFNFALRDLLIHSTSGPGLTTVVAPNTNDTVVLLLGLPGQSQADTTIEGFTFTGGKRGIWTIDSDASFLNCFITANRQGAEFDGGNPTLLNCDISDNYETGGVGCGGGSQPSIIDCIIVNNTTFKLDGGGVTTCTDVWSDCYYDNYGTLPFIQNTVLCGNSPQQITGPWTNGGDTCLAIGCDDSDGDGTLDECGQVGDGVHEVPGEYATIEEAIEAAGTGDVVLVGPGIYTSTGSDVLIPRGKAITIRSTDGPEETILDGKELHRVVNCSAGEQATTVIDGFTISGGAASRGAGVLALGASPTIQNCNIVDNVASSAGGGICLARSDSSIIQCTISNNQALASAAILSLDGDVLIDACTIVGNSTSSNGGLSSGLYVYGHGGESEIELTAQLRLVDTVLSHNVGETETNSIYIDAGALLAYRAMVTIDNCDVVENQPTSDNPNFGGGAMLLAGANAEVTNSRFIKNTVLSTFGGAIHATGIAKGLTSQLILTDSQFQENEALESDGCGPGEAITLDDGTDALFTNITVSGSGAEPIWGVWTDGGGNQIYDDCPGPCPDINGDGMVGTDDILTIISYWGSDDNDADVNGDGIVGTDDLLMVIGAWGPC